MLYENTEALTRAVRDYSVAIREPHDASVALRRALGRMSEAENTTGRFREVQLRSARRRLVRAKKAASPWMAGTYAKKIAAARAAMIEATRHLSSTHYISPLTLEDRPVQVRAGEQEAGLGLRPRMGPRFH